jgi:hypothetical protein
MKTDHGWYMKAALLLACSCGAAQAQDASWILDSQLTPARLVADGAVLTASDSVRWPEGPSVVLTYWRGAGDVVYRCATLLADGASNASCWRQQGIAHASSDASRHISTRQRPAPVMVDPAQSLGYTPYVWLEETPQRARPSPRPRPTPLPTR